MYWKNYFYLMDEGSLNGTFLNGNRISEKRKKTPEREVMLKPGDEITIGATRLLVKFVEEVFGTSNTAILSRCHHPYSKC